MAACRFHLPLEYKMLRISTFLLCVLLAAAAAGRYQAEVQVRQEREAIRNLEAESKEEERRIQVLKAEVAWLESPDRLSKIAREKTGLEPLTGQQLLTSREFVSVVTASQMAYEESQPQTAQLEEAQLEGVREAATPSGDQ